MTGETAQTEKRVVSGVLFTRRRDIETSQGIREYWKAELLGADGAYTTHWWVKNYGPRQDPYEGSPFSGWRFGSGGPFGPERADREGAMRAAADYIRMDAERAAAGMMEKALRIRKALGE